MPLREVITREFAPVTAPLDEVVAWVLEHARVRAGFREFVERGAGRRLGRPRRLERLPGADRAGPRARGRRRATCTRTGSTPRPERLARRLALSGRLRRTAASRASASLLPAGLRRLRRRRLLGPLRRARRPTASSRRAGLARYLAERGSPFEPFSDFHAPLRGARRLSRGAARASRALRLRALDRPLPGLRHRPREPLARGRAAPGRRRTGGADHRSARRSRRRAARRGDRAGRAQAARRRVRPRRVLRVRGAASRCSRTLVAELRGLRPPIAVEPFETPRHVDHGAAGLAARRVRDQEPPDRALRRPRRARVRVPDARADGRSPSRTSSSTLGFSRRKAEYVVGLARSDLDLHGARAPPGRRGQGGAHGAARDRRVDRRLVPRPPPRAPDGRGPPATSACARPSRASTATGAT